MTSIGDKHARYSVPMQSWTATEDAPFLRWAPSEDPQKTVAQLRAFLNCAPPGAEND